MANIVQPRPAYNYTHVIDILGSLRVQTALIEQITNGWETCHTASVEEAKFR